MAIRWVFHCDGPACDLIHEVDGGNSSDQIRDHTVSFANMTVWRGHLCRPCALKNLERIKEIFLASPSAQE